MKVLIFKTNIIHHIDKEKVAECLKNINNIFNWDIDFEDENFTLRVVGSGFTSEQVVQAIQSIGFECEEIV
jgi:copper chaperone CopZ